MISPTRVVRRSELWRMVFENSFFSFSSSSNPGVSISCEKPTMALSGVRISWLIFCMNIVFNLSDSSACFFAFSISLFFYSRYFACNLLYLLYSSRHKRKKNRNDNTTTTIAVNLASSTFSFLNDSLFRCISTLSRLA